MIKRWYKDEKPPAIMSHDEHVCKVIAKDTVHSTPRKGKKCSLRLNKMYKLSKDGPLLLFEPFISVYKQ